MKKLKLFEGLAKQKINEYVDHKYGQDPYDIAYKYEYLLDKPIKELLKIVKGALIEPYASAKQYAITYYANEEELCAYYEIEHRLARTFWKEYEEKYGSTEMDVVLIEKYNNKDWSYRMKDFFQWMCKEVDRYLSVVNESKMIVNESRNPRKGDTIVIDGDLEVKVLHSFTSAKNAAAYERKVNITKDDGYSISEKINSGVIDSNESGLYVYALYEDKIKLFDFTDGDVDWEIKDKK